MTSAPTDLMLEPNTPSPAYGGQLRAVVLGATGAEGYPRKPRQ